MPERGKSVMRGIMEQNSDHVETGQAIDQEKISALRPQIEEYVRDHYGDFARTKLFWNMNKSGKFDFEIHFWKE
jgi:hypothetical protein